MKVLLFGANGFLGKALKATFEQNNVECYTVSRSVENADYKVDISNFADFSNLPTDCFNVVVNCATVLPGGDYLDSDYLEKIYKTNVLGSQNICKWMNNQSSITKIINCSTLVVVQKPWRVSLSEEDTNTYPHGRHVLYCSSKLTQELLFKTFADANSIPLTQIRFSTLYGETMGWTGLLCNLIDQSKKTNSITIANGSSVSADYLHVNDAARIIDAAVKSDVEGIVNGASGVETTILQLAEIIAKNSTALVSISNSETDGRASDRASISIGKLKKMIDVNTFTHLKEGVKKMMQ